MHRVKAGLRALLPLAGGALDGMVVGFAIAYVVATAVSGSSRAIALGPLGDVVLTGFLVVAVLGVIAGALVGVCRVAGRLRDGIRRAFARGGRTAAVGAVLSVPFAFLAAIPASVALMAALLLVIFVLGPVGAGGLVRPDGALGPYIWFGAVVGAGVGLARTASRRVPVTRSRLP